MRIRGVSAAALILGLTLQGNLLAQAPDGLEALRKEIQALREAQLATQKQLQELMQLVRTMQPQPPQAAQRKTPESLAASGAPLKGSKTAALTIIEFSDYQCPYCGRHIRDTWPQIEREYIASGKVNYVFRDFPLESIHPNAFRAAEAARCAGDQGKYWEMHDRLFANQGALGAAQLPSHAQAIGLDAAAFDKCLTSGVQAAAVRRDLAQGQGAGVTGTPAFFLGVMDQTTGNVKVLRSLVGAQPFSSFKTAIDALLAPAASK